MQTIESAQVLKEQIESGEFYRCKDMIQATCECGKKFFLNMDELGIKTLCSKCEKSNQKLITHKES